MAFISISYSFVNGTSIDATQVNTNNQDIINGTSDGTKDFNISALTCAGLVDLNNTVQLGTDVRYELAPTSLYKAPTKSLIYKDANTITMQAGRYFLNNKVYTLAANLDWTWAASGQNGGLDTGTEANSTWYYLYATLISNTVGIVASTTTPTAVFDTNLSGTSFDTNTYLGAFFNDSGGSIKQFSQNGDMTLINIPLSIGSETSNSFNPKTPSGPATMSQLIVKLYENVGAAGAISRGSVSSDGTNTYSYTEVVSVNLDGGATVFPIPITDSSLRLWIKSSANNANSTCFLDMVGWKDKWL